MFLHLSVILFTEGGHAWLRACLVGGMHGWLEPCMPPPRAYGGKRAEGILLKCWLVFTLLYITGKVEIGLIWIGCTCFILYCRYLQLLRSWFKQKITREDFDHEARQLVEVEYGKLKTYFIRDERAIKEFWTEGKQTYFVQELCRHCLDQNIQRPTCDLVDFRGKFDRFYLTTFCRPNIALSKKKKKKWVHEILLLY